MSITLELTSSPDESMIGKFVFQGNILFIGSARPSDLIIQDKNIHQTHLSVRIYKNELLVETIDEEYEFTMNGITIRGMRKIFPAVSFIIGNSTFRVLDYKPEPYPNDWSEQFNANLTEIERNKPHMTRLLSAIQEKIKMLRLQSLDTKK